MDIQDKTKEELQAELTELQREFYYLNAIKDIDAAKRIQLEQELAVALQEIVFQEEEKAKRAAELIIANLELKFQSEEKAKRAAELVIANIELVFQNKEKAKRAAELIVANKELSSQNEEKGKRAAELQKSKDKAEESEERYRLLHENAGIGIGYYKVDGTIISYNSIAASNMNGVPEDFNGKSIYDFFPKSVAEFYLERIKKAVVSETPVTYEDEVNLPNGNKYFLSTFTRIINTDGEIEGIQILSHDITDRKQAEEQIRFQAHITANSPVITAYHDKELNMVWANNAYQKATGLSLEEIKGKKCYQVWNLSKPCSGCPVITAIETGENAAYELTPDNQKHWPANQGYWLSQATPVRDAQGAIIGAIEFSIDITERKQAEEKLIKSEERYALVIEASEQGIWDWNVETNELFYSQQWKRQIGYEDHELKNDFNTWVEHLHPDEKEYCQSVVNSYLNQPGEHLIMDFRFRHKDGTYRWIHNKAASLKNAEGKVIRLFGSHTDFTESKLSEAIFKDIIEKNPMSIQILDMEGYPIQVNSAHTKLFGVEPPSDYSVFKDPQLISLGFGKLFEQIKNGEVVYFPDSYYNVHEVDPSFPDFPAWIAAIGFTLNDINGKSNRIVLMHENITERKNAEALLNDIIENNPMSIQVVDLEGHTLRCNPAFIELFGSVPPHEFSIFDDLKSKSSELESLVSKVKNGETVHLPDIYFNPHDAIAEAPDLPRWIRALIFPLNDSVGKRERFVFMHENITERKSAEQELVIAKEKAEENEAKYKQIFDNTFDIMAIYEVTEDRRYKVMTFNAAEAKLLGPVEYYQDRYIDDCVPPELYNEFKQHYERCIEAEKLIAYEENVTFQDINKTFNTQLIPLKNNAGRVHRIIVISRDITDNIILQTQLINQNEELKSLNSDLTVSKQKAEESDKLKSAFLANMSHEIRTPMNGILGFAELLKKPDLTGDQQQEYIKIIEKSGVRMLNIINDIIDISKIEANLMNVNSKDCNINEKIEFIYTFFKPQVEEKGMQLFFRNTLPAKEAIIRTDSEKVYSILTNLVKNAIKYSKEGAIEFGYDVDSGSRDKACLVSTTNKIIKFYVKDTGIGIPKNRQEAIFERFIQADISDKMARQGAGLGLSISKAYVEMLGGKIWVESEEGIGSTFYFTLPYNALSVEKNVVGKVVLAQDEKIQIKKLKILIAEDDETSEMLIAIIVDKFGKEILKARTGFEAVEVCRNNPDIDLILMDFQMPVMNGYDATRQIREFNKDVVILAQTAFGLSGDREKAIEAGCNDYIAKPINKAELLSLMQKYFEK